MKIIERPSPNFDSRDDHPIDMLVLHYTGMVSATLALDKLCDPASKVSAHYVVDEDGTIYKMVDEANRAWHAGVSSWRGQSNINQRSIGIEIVNPGHEFGYRKFTAPQMGSVIELCKDIISRHNIPARNVVGHSDVAPSRKEDPGELFDWKLLAEEGIGLWPNIGANDSSQASSLMPHTLSSYGYDTTDLPKAITAFQRHFRPNDLSGQWDNECATLLASLMAMV